MKVLEVCRQFSPWQRVVELWQAMGTSSSLPRVGVMRHHAHLKLQGFESDLPPPFQVLSDCRPPSLPPTQPPCMHHGSSCAVSVICSNSVLTNEDFLTYVSYLVRTYLVALAAVPKNSASTTFQAMLACLESGRSEQVVCLSCILQKCSKKASSPTAGCPVVASSQPSCPA